MAGNGISLILGISVTKQLCQFLHSCIDNLVRKISPIPEIPPSEVDWSEEDYKEARNLIQIIFKKMVSQHDYNIEEELNEFSSEQIDCIKECFEIRKSEIQQAIILQRLAKENYLVTDYDWKLKWVIGSSALSAVREPLLQMDLLAIKTDHDDKVLRDTIKLEMNIAEMNNFIQEIEKSLQN